MTDSTTQASSGQERGLSIGATAGNGRIYIVALWASALALLIAAGDASFSHLSARAAERKVLLLPQGETDEATRKELLATLRSGDQVQSARWISPQNLAQTTSRGVPSGLWPSVFADETAWLPWIAEARMADPLREADAVGVALAGLRTSGDWELVLWDGAALKGDLETRKRIARVLAPLGTAIFILGMIGLFLTPRRQGGRLGEAFCATVATLAVVSIVLGLATFSDVEIEGRTWILAAIAGFALAGLIGPMLEKKGSPPIHFKA